MEHESALAFAVAAPATAPAFDTLYATHVDYVWLTLRRLGVLEADVPDVAHDVFMTVHRRLSSYDPALPARPWLFGIALRLAANHRRSRRRRREVTTDVPEAVDGGLRPDAQLAARQAHALVFAALDTLPDDQRAVFVLHELEGRAAPAIAADLELPLNTVYSRLRLGRERFARAVTRLRGKDAAS